MVSPTNSDLGLTHETPITPEGTLRALYPSGARNYVRVYPREDVQAAGAALFARDLGATRVAVVKDGETPAFHFAQTARGLGLEVALARRWRPQARTYSALAAAVANANAGAVLVSGLIDSNGGQLIEDLRSRLPSRTAVIAGDGFLPIAQLFANGGAAARGMYLSLAELPVERLPREGRHFVSQFAATRSSRRCAEDEWSGGSSASSHSTPRAT